jgi:nitrate reductase NapAB chaperone NapD
MACIEACVPIMTVQSYLVYPEAGRVEAVSRSLSDIPSCEVIRAENRDLLILVTETDDAQAQKKLETQIEELAGVECVALVSGWTE